MFSRIYFLIFQFTFIALILCHKSHNDHKNHKSDPSKRMHNSKMAQDIE